MGDPCEQTKGDCCNRSRFLSWVWPSFPSQQVPPCVSCRFCHKGSLPRVWMSFHHKGSHFGFGHPFCHKGSSLGFGHCFHHNRSPFWFGHHFHHKGSPLWFGCCFCHKVSSVDLAVLSSQTVPPFGFGHPFDQGKILVNDQGGTLWTAEGDPCKQPKEDCCNRSRVLPWLWPSFPSQQVPPCVYPLFLPQTVPLRFGRRF